MPALMILTVLVQVLFAVHVHRTGRSTYWMYLIMMVPVMGCLIYFVIEVLPEVIRGPAGKHAKRSFRSLLDPEKDFRDAKYAFDTSPTVANRINLAQLLIAKREYDAVIALLEPALTNHFSDDILLLEGLAYAYYDKGDYNNALKYIQKIYERPDAQPQDYIKLLRARAHISLNELTVAEEQLRSLVEYFTGEEARITLAQLYERMGRKAQARAVYQEVVTRSSHSPKYYQKSERQWIDMAKQALK
ncbi:MAG: tetratricopeptide repeat protein [Alphaproteobacteria bacterium]|nr:tetratricopeptide repeat protein [Alphaproteobacteria bacterium]